MSGFAQFGVGATEQIKKQQQIDKIRERRDIAAEATGKRKMSAVDKAIADAPKPPEVPLAERPVTPAQIQQFLGDDASTTSTKRARPTTKTKAKPANVDAPTDQDETDRRTAIQKYRGYYNGPHTQRFCDKIAPNDSWSLEQALSHLERVRGNCRASATLDLTATAVEHGLKGVEYVVHGLGLNPFKWQLVDRNGVRASQVFAANKDAPEFQPAMSEIGAECGLMLDANCYMRFGHAMFNFLNQFSDNAKRVSTSEPKQ